MGSETVMEKTDANHYRVQPKRCATQGVCKGRQVTGVKEGRAGAPLKLLTWVMDRQVRPLRRHGRWTEEQVSGVGQGISDLAFQGNDRALFKNPGMSCNCGPDFGRKCEIQDIDLRIKMFRIKKAFLEHVISKKTASHELPY